MVRFLLDENFSGPMARAFMRMYPEADVVRAQDTEIYKANDRTMMLWAVQAKRLLVSHDKTTLPGYFKELVEEGSMPCGVIIVKPNQTITEVVDDLATIAFASEQEEWEGKITYLPLTKRRGER